MSHLAELIEELCPDGVEYRPLLECVVLPSIPRGLKRSQYESSGSYPIVDQGKEQIAGYTCDETKLVRDVPGIVFGDHTREVKYVDYFFVPGADGVKWIRAVNGIGIRYLFHCLLSLSIPSRGYNRHWNLVHEMRIPVPPLEVQREIVRILDQFTTLEAELEAELEARRTQYEHYRNHLLSYESLAAYGPVEMVKLGELAHIATGGRNTSDAVEDGTYPFYVRSQVPLSLNEYDFDESAVLTAGDGVGVGRVFHHVEGKYALHQRAYRIVPNLELLSSRYLYHVMVSQFGRYLESTVFHSSVTSVRKPMLERFPVAVPAMEEQDRVADVLDRFDALVNDITSGLPAEIAARRAQYEHYRDRLLSFPEKAVSGSDAS